MSRIPLARLSSLRASQRIGLARRPALAMAPSVGPAMASGVLASGAAVTRRRPGAGAVPTWVVREAERLRGLWLADLAMAAAEGLPVRR